MTKLLLALALLISAPALAQVNGYTCVPGLYGTTLDVAAPKRYDAGWRLVWLCKGDGDKVHISTLACVHGTCVESTLRNVYMAASTAADPKAAIDAAVMQYVTGGSCSTATGNLKTICDLATADGRALFNAYQARVSAPPPPPPEVWKVAYNFGLTTRPAFAYADGVRATTSTARATVDANCYCDVKLVEGSTTYCAVNQARTWVSVCTKR